MFIYKMSSINMENRFWIRNLPIPSLVSVILADDHGTFHVSNSELNTGVGKHYVL